MHTAKLVWVTPDAERLIGKLARVSNPANEDNPNVERLIKYLIKHKHWSPFEMASMCVEIQTTRAIGAQILRHRSFSFQEFSQRYAEVTEIEVPQLRRQDLNNRQNSIDDFPEELSLFVVGCTTLICVQVMGHKSSTHKLLDKSVRFLTLNYQLYLAQCGHSAYIKD